jgi:hypothetical protein
VRQRGLDRVDRAQQDRVDRVGPGLQRRLTHHAGDAGLRHDHVQLAQLGDAALDRLGQLAAVPDIGLHGNHPAVELLDRGGGLLQVI